MEPTVRLMTYLMSGKLEHYFLEKELLSQGATTFGIWSFAHDISPGPGDWPASHRQMLVMALNWDMSRAFKKTAKGSQGSLLVGIGGVASIIGILLILINLGSTSGSGGNIVIGLTLAIAGLLLVMVGYLKRIAVALENR